MRHFLTFLVIFSLTATAAAQTQKPPTYWNDIRPIFRKYCTVCHSAKNIQEVDVSGGLALDSYDAVLKNAKKPVIVPGKSKESLLLQLLVTTDEDRRMPKGSSQPLPQPAIETIARWIDAGAPEGQRPEEVVAANVPASSRRVRHLDVILRTNTTPPASVVKASKPGPLELVLPVGPLAPVTALRYHPTRPVLAVGQYGRITLWDLAQGQPLRVLTNVLGAINDLRFSPDGQYLAVAGGQPSFKGDLRIYRTDNWELVAVLRGHEDSVFSVAFSPDGKRLASASFDKTVRIWNLQSHRAEVIITGHSDFVYAVSFSPDGKWLASASKDRSVKIFDAATGQSLVTLSGMNLDVTAVAVHPNGKELVSAGFEPAIVWWSAEPGSQRSGNTAASGGQRIRTQAGHGATVHELTFSPDGKLLASASADGTVRLWNGQNGAPLQTITIGSVQYAVAWRPDAAQLAAGGFDGIVRIYDVKSSRLLVQLISLPEEQGQPRWLAQVPEGYFAASPSILGQLKWRIQNQDLEPQAIHSALAQPQWIRQALTGQSVPPPFAK
ncbi:Protein TolB [bacterium HR36]|nr:Protein TolB [bacterium HR36]